MYHTFTTFSNNAFFHNPSSQKQLSIRIIRYSHLTNMILRCSIFLILVYNGSVQGVRSAQHDVVPLGRKPPTLDDLWIGQAFFKPHIAIPINSNGFQHVDAGTRIVVVNTTWYLFGRWDTGATAKCPGGEISINVRSSTNQGATWSLEHSVVKPDEVTTCTCFMVYFSSRALLLCSASLD